VNTGVGKFGGVSWYSPGPDWGTKAGGGATVRVPEADFMTPTG
jgi:hypothetical protein